MPATDSATDTTHVAHPEDVIASLADLESRLGTPVPAALQKVTTTIHPLYQRIIEASPFAVIATHGADGMDASPRGDPAGFAVVADPKALLLPERRGNQRADTLRNLVVDPRIGILFLVPGLGETLRVNGRARLRTAPALLERFLMQGKPPFCVLEVTVDAVYFQCARAILRAGLWQPAPPRESLNVPTPGALLSALTAGEFDGKTYDQGLSARQQATLY